MRQRPGSVEEPSVASDMGRLYSPDRAPVKSGRMTGLAGGRRSYHNDGAMTLRMTRRFVVVAVLAATGLGRPALAQEWPTRPVLVVSPFTAGSANDIVARLVFDQVGQQIGQAFVVENRPGGGGIVGVAAVVRAEPDGYTLLLSSASMSSAVILHRSLPYDELRDLEPIAMLGAQPSVLVAAPGKGFKTVAELVAAAKARPGELNFASAGIGSASHIAGERFRLAAGLEVQHIPYRGPVEALADLVTGRIDFYFLPIAPALPLIKQGQVIALAVSTPKRAQLLPEVPTIAEAGYPSAEGRRVGAGRDLADDRRGAQSRHQHGAGDTGHPRKVTTARRRGHADDARSFREILR